MTPKEQFLETPHAEPHRKLVQTDAFREALNYAMLQFQQIALSEERVDADAFTHARIAAQLAGAARFCKVLQTLGTVAEVPHGTQHPSLNHDAYDPRRRTG